MLPDRELLRQFLDERDDRAIAGLIQRHVDFVFSAALRQVGGDAHSARDVVQHVFIDLVRKAHALRYRPTLEGWLYTSTHYAAAKLVRAERCRRRLEQEAVTMSEPASTTPPADWTQLRPVLDEVMHELGETDREAVLLRYFARQPLAEIGERLGLSENAAAKRVERALEKLHGLLAKRGVTSTASALGVALAHQAVAIAPAGLAASVTGAVLTGTAAATAGSLASILYFMSASKTTLSMAAAGAVVMGVAVYESVEARAANETLAQQQRNVATAASRLAELQQNVSAAANERAELESSSQRRQAQRIPPATPTTPLDDPNAKYREIIADLNRNDSERRKAQAAHDRLRAGEAYRTFLQEQRLTDAQKELALDILAKPIADALPEFRAAFGDAAGDQLAKFRAPGRQGAQEVVNELSAKLYFTDVPFTPQAAGQLVRLIETSGRELAFPRQSNESATHFWRRSRDWPRIQAEAERFLTAEQQRGLAAFIALQANTELLASAVHVKAAQKP